jgi:hypothetical protein
VKLTSPRHVFYFIDATCRRTFKISFHTSATRVFCCTTNTLGAPKIGYLVGREAVIIDLAYRIDVSEATACEAARNAEPLLRGKLLSHRSVITDNGDRDREIDVLNAAAKISRFASSRQVGNAAFAGILVALSGLLRVLLRMGCYCQNGKDQ